MELTPETQQVLAPLPKAAIFLVVTVRPGAEGGVREFLTDVADVTRAVSFHVSEADLTCVVGIGSHLWDRLFPELPRPAGLHPFREMLGDKHTAVGTPGDLLFHLRADRLDLCFELARQLSDLLGDSVEVVDEVHGFRYLDRRDLLGFVDGTENPTGDGASDAVNVTDDDPAYVGSSYALVQKYLHDLDDWNALSVEEQELVIGRRKFSDTELSDDEKPLNSHVAANTVVDADGTEQEIVRSNMPFGSVGSAEFGTYFIGYSATSDVIETMLERMFIGDPPGNYDRILDFSTAVTGGLFFIPTEGFLEDQTVCTDNGSEIASEESPRTDDSLGIGSLRESGAS